MTSAVAGPAEIGLATMIMVFVLGGSPLSLPPRDYDPLLLNAPPEECVLYFSQAGFATPQSRAEAQGEQLLADPEIERFVRELVAMARPLLDRAASGRSGDQLKVLMTVAADAAKSPFCLYVE